MVSLPPTVEKARKEKPLQLARVVVKVDIYAGDIVHQVKIISLLHFRESQRAAVAVARLQVHLDIQLVDTRKAEGDVGMRTSITRLAS